MSKIPIGTTLIESLPFVHCLIFEKKRILCDYCFLESSKLYQCSKCKFMHYCNANCQRSDWQIHKHECDKFTQFTNNLDLKKEFQNDIVRLYLRILIKSKINDQSNISDEYGLKTFVTLMDHYENLVKDMNRIKTMQKCLSLIKELMGVDFMSKFSIKELISAFGKMVVNTMAVSNYELSESIGSGLYLSAAYYDHSCEPNSVVTFNGSKVIVRNIRDLEPNEEPVISYCELLMSKKQRQDYLMRCYYFKCQCFRCVQKTYLDEKLITLKCIDCKKNSIKIDLFDNDNESISCLNCVENEGKVKWRQFYLDLKDLFNDVNTMKKLDKRNNLILVRVKCMINKLEDDIDQDEDDGTLLNVYLIKLYEWLFEMYVEFEQFDLANLIAKQKLLSSYKFFLPRNHPSIGLLLLKIVKLMNNGDECKKSISYLKEANDVLKVCFKENSQIFNVINELKAVCL